MPGKAEVGLGKESVTFTTPDQAVVRDLLELGRAGWPTHDPAFWISAAKHVTKELELAGVSPEAYKAMLQSAGV